MTVEEMRLFQDNHDEEFLKFRSIKGDTPSQRADLCAMILIDSLLPGIGDIVSAAEHDQIWLDADAGALAPLITEDQWLYLIRCGVMLDDDSLSLYV